MKRLTLILLSILVLNVTGCASLSHTSWCCPGTAEDQKHRAEVYDPFPQAGYGSEMMGVRPPGFERPRVESPPEDPLPCPAPADYPPIP
jgi:hypothetical protein